MGFWWRLVLCSQWHCIQMWENSSVRFSVMRSLKLLRFVFLFTLPPLLSLSLIISFCHSISWGHNSKLSYESHPLLLSCAVLSFFFVLCSVCISGCDLSLSFSLLLVQSSLMRPAQSLLLICVLILFFPLVFFLVSLCVCCLLLVFVLL